jgi:hypothetical protein
MKSYFDKILNYGQTTIARQSGDVSNYHKQLAEEYKSGFSLQDIAKGLGLGSAAPLYYGAQRSLQKGE